MSYNKNNVIREIKRVSENPDHRFNFIAKYIVTNLDSVQNKTISQLAEATYTSITTINRFTKYLELDGYKELTHILKFYYELIKKEDIYSELKGDNFLDNVYQKLTNEMNENYLLLSKQFEQGKLISQDIKNASRIVIYAVGGTFNTAKDFADKLLRLGFHVFCFNDYHTSYFVAKQLDEKDLVIFVSYSGETKDLIAIAKICSDRNLNTIFIGKYGLSTISKMCKNKFFVNSNQTTLRAVSSLSRYALLFALDTIYYLLFTSDSEKYQKILDDTVISKF